MTMYLCIYLMYVCFYLCVFCFLPLCLRASFPPSSLFFYFSLLFLSFSFSLLSFFLLSFSLSFFLLSSPSFLLFLFFFLLFSSLLSLVWSCVAWCLECFYLFACVLRLFIFTVSFDLIPFLVAGYDDLD